MVSTAEKIGSEQGADKREADRAPLGATVSWSLDQETWHDDSSQDLSSTGMMLRTRYPILPGSVITLNFKIPNLMFQKPIVVEAEVVRPILRQGGQLGLGLKFLTLKSHDELVVKEFICRILGLPLDDVIADLGVRSAAGYSFEMERVHREAEAKKAEIEELRRRRAEAEQRKAAIGGWFLRGLRIGFLFLGLFVLFEVMKLILEMALLLKG